MWLCVCVCMCACKHACVSVPGYNSVCLCIYMCVCMCVFSYSWMFRRALTCKPLKMQAPQLTPTHQRKDMMILCFFQLTVISSDDQQQVWMPTQNPYLILHKLLTSRQQQGDDHHCHGNQTYHWDLKAEHIIIIIIITTTTITLEVVCSMYFNQKPEEKEENRWFPCLSKFLCTNYDKNHLIGIHFNQFAFSKNVSLRNVCQRGFTAVQAIHNKNIRTKICKSTDCIELPVTLDSQWRPGGQPLSLLHNVVA